MQPQLNGNGKSFMGLSMGDLAKLGMNVVLLFMLWQLWTAYQEQSAKMVDLVRAATVQVTEMNQLQRQVDQIIRQHEAMINPRGT